MKKKKIYVASSWRNETQPFIVDFLRELGYDVYDFKHPDIGDGFQWTDVDKNWKKWSMKEYRDALYHPYAHFGYFRDFKAMVEADICVLCLPCGRSAHLEAGWMKGAGKKVIAYISPDITIEPELMYLLLDDIALDIYDLKNMLEGGE